MTSIKKNYLFSSAYQLLNIAVPLVTTPYLSRTIGADGNGLFTYTQSIANYFVLFAQLGITNYGVREIARCSEDRAARTRTFWDIFAMNVLWGSAVVAMYIAYALTLGSSNLTLLLIWLCWVVGSVVDITWLLNGCQEFKVPMVRNACTRLAGMAFIFLFVHTEADVWAYVTAIAVPFLANALLVWPFLGRYVDWLRPTLRGALYHLKPNLVLFVPVVAISLYTLLDKIMLGSIAGMGQTGLYDYSEKISKMPLALVTALGAVVLPKMTEVISAGRREEALELIHETMWFMEAVALGLAFGIIGVAQEFVPVFFGAGYDECVPLMCLLSAIIPLISASNVVGVQYLIPSGRDLQYTISVLAGAGVNVAINVAFISRYGALAAAAATVAAEFAVFVVQAWITRGEIGLSKCLIAVLPFVSIGALMASAIRVLAGAMGAFATTFFGLALEVLAGMTVYLTLAFVWCLATKNAYFYRLLGRWLPKGLRERRA